MKKVPCAAGATGWRTAPPRSRSPESGGRSSGPLPPLGCHFAEEPLELRRAGLSSLEQLLPLGLFQFIQ
eukprot:5792076-Pyramimonas_sp.AAC.1